MFLSRMGEDEDLKGAKYGIEFHKYRDVLEVDDALHEA
jgi:hypothetical protein